LLKIAQSVLDAIRLHGEQTYPHECCGVLLGRMDGAEEKTALASAPCGNTRSDSPQNRYNIDPRELVRIQRQAREAGHDIVGFYHSHPDHPARWSPTDLAEAHWLGCSYVITRVERGSAQETNSFVLLGDSEENKRFQAEPLTAE
jgi:proteasome lid subunit RPN8/RPN11